MKKSDLFAVLFLLLSLPVFAQPEFLDHGFGTAGRQVLTRPAYDEVRDIIVQPDGKILLAGASFDGTSRYSLVRYNADGSLDTGFGLDGKNYTFYLPDDVFGSINDVALQPDGKIVALGNVASRFDLVRYHADGYPDNSFSSPDFPHWDDYLALVIAPDGKILLAGYKYSGDGHFMVSRFKSDGTKDISFGTNGVVAFDFGTKFEGAQDVAVQPDGKILVTGAYENGLVLVRLNANGAPDTSFNTNGKLLIDGGAISYYGRFLFIRPDGKIVVSATGTGGISLFRFNPDGSPDDTFGVAGVATVGKYGGYDDFIKMRPDGSFWVACWDNTGKNVILKLTPEGVPDTGFADSGVLYTTPEWHLLAVQADSALVVATTTDDDFALGRYLPTGNFDSAFHQGTPVVTNIGQSGGQFNALAVQSDGKIVGVGVKGWGEQAMVRLNGDGSPDSGFLARTAFLNNKRGALHALFPQPDGKLVVGGGIIYQEDNGIDFTEGVLYRFLPDGTLDTTFSNKAAAFIKALARQPDGRFLATGTDEGKMGHANYVRPRLVRYLADGAVDSSFGTGGMVAHPCRCDLLALQADGKILVAGRKEPDTFMVIRYDSNGAPDPAFGTNGRIQETGSVDLMTLQPDGRILLAANTDDGLTLSRYVADGTPDDSFGAGGKRFLPLKPYDDIYAMGLQADGKIVLAGGAETLDFLLARLLPDGSPDTAVGLGGFVYTDFGETEDFATALAIQPDGKIMLGGQSFDYNGAFEKSNFALARYRADLSVETKEVYGRRFYPLKITPNPVTDVLNIQLPETAAVAPAEVQVFDTPGRLLLHDRLAIEQLFDVRRLPPGAYILKVFAGGRAYGGRFVKL